MLGFICRINLTNSQLAPRHEVITVGRSSGDLKADISDRQSIVAMYKKAGKVDAVVCTAGNVHFGPLADFTEDQFMLGLSDKALKVQVVS